jgi:hypothetical protein
MNIYTQELEKNGSPQTRADTVTHRTLCNLLNKTSKQLHIPAQCFKNYLTRQAYKNDYPIKRKGDIYRRKTVYLKQELIPLRTHTLQLIEQNKQATAQHCPKL